MKTSTYPTMAQIARVVEGVRRAGVIITAVEIKQDGTIVVQSQSHSPVDQEIEDFFAR